MTLLVGRDGKSAHLELPELQIESANLQLGGSTLQTGRVTLAGLVLDAAFDQPDMIQPARALARFDRLDAGDLLLAKSQNMLTITRLVVSTLRLAAGTIDTVAPGAGGGRGVAIPFPLLVVPMLALFALLALPVYLYRKIASLVDQGLESATGEHFATDIAERTKAISFTLGSLDIDTSTLVDLRDRALIGVMTYSFAPHRGSQVRIRLTAGGRWIRTSGSAPAATPLSDREGSQVRN